MRVQVEGEYTAAIQVDEETVQGSVLSPLLFDLVTVFGKPQILCALLY